MARPLAQKLLAAWRLLAPPAEARAYARLLRRSPAFDRAFYLASNPRLHPLFRLLPERHYVAEGEAVGLCPHPAFSPTAYLIHNPDLPRDVRPLRHWIERGEAEGRATLAPPGGDVVPAYPAIGPEGGPEAPAPVAVVLHLYHADLWEEMRAALEPFAFDLFVTLTGPAAGGDLPARIPREVPGARAWALPNRGRDVLPFLHLAASGLLAPYAAVLKLHGKASPHRADGAAWRRALLAGVLDPARTEARLLAFLADDAAGLWVADGHGGGEADWGMNRARATALLARAGIAPEGPLRFPAGSIFWMKPAVVAGLARLGLGPADFEPEMGLVDGTAAHAVERIVGAVARAAGLGLREARDLDRAARDRP